MCGSGACSNAADYSADAACCESRCDNTTGRCSSNCSCKYSCHHSACPCPCPCLSSSSARRQRKACCFGEGDCRKAGSTAEAHYTASNPTCASSSCTIHYNNWNKESLVSAGRCIQCEI